MSSRRIPAGIPIPAGIDPELRRTLTAVKESLEVTTGQRGDPLERAPTIRELTELDILEGVRFDSQGRLVRDSGSAGQVGSEWTGPLPAPTSVAVVGTALSFMVSWDHPPGAASAIAYTEVYAQGPSDWGESLPAADLGAAELAGISPFKQLRVNTEPNRQWRFFIRFVGHFGQTGPWHDVNGTTVFSGRLASDVFQEMESKLMDSNDPDTFQVIAPNMAFWNPGPSYSTDPTDKDLVFGYDDVTYDWNGDGTQTTEPAIVMRNVFITGQTTIDFATVNFRLKAGQLTVTGDLNEPDFDGIAIRTPSIDGGQIFGSEIMVGEGGLFGPVGDQSYKTYIDASGNVNISGQFLLQRSSSGERLEITDTYIRSYDSSGVLRVQIGALI